jgi:oligopeptide/dipeptide ABC transporter ATP-binding protein
MTTPNAPLLVVKNLSVDFQTDRGVVQANSEISYTLERGKTLGIVGESGSGKSVSSLALIGLLAENSATRAQEVTLQGRSLLGLTPKEWQKIRGPKIAMIFQDPMTSLNPCYTIEAQLLETLHAHFDLDRTQARLRAIDLLKKVGIPAPEQRMKSYPHELSGGMAQRVMIALAIACEPDVLIADEPTTALDVTVQAQILELLKTIQKQNGMAMLLITHDLALVSESSDQLAVMYAGQIVEIGATSEVLSRPRHPYTLALLKSLAANQVPGTELQSIPGTVPSLITPPPGCRFAGRCSKKKPRCEQESPALVDSGSESRSRCFFWEEL